MNKVPLKLEKIKSAKFLIFAGPTKKLNENDMIVLKQYIEQGGNVLLMSQHGGDKKSRSNLNKFLKDFNIKLNNNSVIRTNYYKYFHPKEAFISNGVLHDDFIRIANNEKKQKKRNRFLVAGIGIERDREIEDDNLTGFDFVYPYGTSLLVKSPSIPILTSGSVCYPVNEALMAYYES